MKMATKTMADTSGAKRRKTTVDRLRLSDLPDALLVDVARYLSRPSAALFAVAVSTPQPQSATSKAIISSLGDDANGHWSVLDFGDIEKSLAKILTDKDVQDVLSMIDAPNNLKTLKLTGCVNIDGSGLKSLSSSKVLQQIDLSLVGQHDKPGIKPDPLISEEVVLPILDSIIQSSENKMKHIQLPKKWRAEISTHQFLDTITLLHQFLERYDQMLESREQNCSKCDSDCHEWSIPHVDTCLDGTTYGLQSHICYVCTNLFCYQCDEEGAGYRRSNFRYCSQCERDYCIDCKPPGCSTCDKNYCLECIGKCDACGSVCCGECHQFLRCKGSGCTKLHCDDCFDGKKYDIEYCVNGCNGEYCSDCRYENITDGSENCDMCKSSVVDVALAKQKETETENNRLRQEMEELRQKVGTKHIEVENEIKQLRQEIEELREQNLILQEKSKSRS